jgi:hypothetical protein
MKDYEHHHRVLAALSYMEFSDNINAAVQDFSKHCHILDLKVPADPRKFVQRWGQEWQKHHSVVGRASRSGRKPKLSDDDAALLIVDMMNWAKFGLKGPFVSLKQLKKTSPQAKAILEAADASTSTIIRKLKEIEPKLAYKKLTVKPKLSRPQRSARLRVATHHITLNDRVLECVVWVDAKTMYMTIKTRCGWIRVDDGTPFETTRPASKKNPITLRYYIGVCAHAGAVFLMFYTGTTGMKADRDPTCVWLVSSSNVQLGLPPSYCIINGLVDNCSPASRAASWFARYQPHHLETLLHGTCCYCMIPCNGIIQAGLAAAAAVTPCVRLTVVLLALNSNQHTGGL